MPLGSHASCLNIIRLGHPETFTGSGRADPMKSTDRERDVMESLGLDYMVVFPTGMLSLGMHPQLQDV